MSLQYSHLTLVSGYLFDSCQLTITWMSNTKLNSQLNTDSTLYALDS